MRFKAQPNLFVRIGNETHKRLLGKTGIQFNGDGYFETDNPLLIKILPSASGVEVVQEENTAVEEVKGETIKKCKKCDYTTTNQGELLAHYRKEHSK
jgi:hypothetical protein